jgi:hypothetical protein
VGENQLEIPMEKPTQKQKLVCVIGFHLRPKERKVCLARQMRKIGKGLRKGPGGKFEPDKHKDLIACLIDEMSGEMKVAVDPSTIRKVALIRFDNLDPEMPVVVAHVYTFESPDEPQATEEVEPEWFPYDELPDDMPESDKFWVPSILRGKLVSGKVRYMDKTLREIDKMNIKEVETLPEDVR